MSDEIAMAFGRYTCSVPGFETAWVQFKPRGYPFRLRREWRAALSDEANLTILLAYVQDWHLTDLDGRTVPWGDDRTPTLLDNVDGALVAWLVNRFSRWLLVDSTQPPKASSPS